MKKYLVVTPVQTRVDPVCDDGTGPLEEYADVVEVEASSKREAKIKAVRSKEFREWVSIQRGDGENPFSGLRVEEIQEGA